MNKNFTDRKSRSIKKCSITAAAMVCAFFVFLGCDRQSRYKVLTFFFEGVPDPNAVRAKAAVSVSTGIDENTKTIIIEKPKTPAELALYKQKHHSRHKFLKDCDKCHEGGLRTGIKELRQPMPDLCYSCHKDFSRLGKYLHGPINVGECVFCHDLHGTLYIKLQKEPQPKLCYNCHRRESISEIENHKKVLDLICTECHDPHVSSLPKMMKKDAVSFAEMIPADPNDTDSVPADPNNTDLGEDTNTIIIE